jgi:predicted dehydrogenase
VTSADSGAVSAPARLVLVGVRGFGEVHAERIARLAGQGMVELVAAVDPGVVLDPPVIYGAPLFADLEEALAAVGPVDVVVVAAPLGAHFPLASIALSAGADVYLEKPPVTALDDFTRLLELEQQTGRVVQVGFQSLGSHAVELLRTDAFGIGPPVRVGAVGAWSRTVGYWSRSAWSGRRNLHGRAVVDGVATNALAHAVVTALAVVGCRTLADVDAVETDLYRANAIDCDDTSVIRIRATSGLEVTCALTLSAPQQREPEVHVQGTSGRATFAYTADRVEITGNGPAGTETTPRTDLVENLLAHRREGAALLVPLASTGAFMRVLAAIADADEPTRIDPRAIRWEGEGDDRRAIVPDIEHWLAEAVRTSRTFTELGAPWTHRERDSVLARAEVAGVEVARYLDGRGTIPTSSPRPVLHPVRTLAGVVLTARHPADHDWHLGISVAIPDVNGTSFWGGGTYVHGQGYVLLDNHGRIVGGAPAVRDDGFSQELEWVGHDGSVVLREQRSVRWALLDERSWKLTFDFTLTADATATLNSPGSKGRVGGGYGGFAWRFPECDDVQVFTAEARGEDEVHGRTAPWLAWSADFAAGPGRNGPATAVVAGAQAATAGEPWFVRVRDYPGIGSALAWDRPVVLQPGDALSRSFTIALADGRLSPTEVTDLTDELLTPALRPAPGAEARLRARR